MLGQGDLHVVRAFDAEDPLGAEDVSALLDHEGAQPGVHAGPVALAAHLNAHRGHAVIMLVVFTTLLQPISKMHRDF